MASAGTLSRLQRAVETVGFGSRRGTVAVNPGDLSDLLRAWRRLADAVDALPPPVLPPVNVEGRRGDFIQTAGGGVFWPLDPRAAEVRIRDIAHSLSHLCRYAGHCREHYSVAQHSVLVSRALPDDLKLWGLLHDAAEAYVVDVPRPLKPYLAGYAGIEAGVMAVIAERFGLSGPMPPEVKRVDAAILADEQAQLMAPCLRDWTLTEPPLGIEIVPWSPYRAREIFLAEFVTLTGEAGR